MPEVRACFAHGDELRLCGRGMGLTLSVPLDLAWLPTPTDLMPVSSTFEPRGGATAANALPEIFA